jgi:hypothetical protein
MDGLAFGQSLVGAVESVNGQKTVPTFVFSADATEEEIYHRVWNGEYWAAVTANAGSTEVRGYL